MTLPGPIPDPAACRALILHDRPALYLDALRRRFPQVSLSACTDPAQVGSALQATDPQVVFSVKCAGLPGPAHRAALLHPSVRWIQVGGAGFDHLQPVERRDVTITNAAGVLSPFMAETVLGAMLMLNVGFPRYLAQQRARRWQMNPWSGLAGRTALVVGLGEIGRRVAAHARHLGMRVLGLRARGGEVDGIDELVPAARLHDALARADVVCLHVPLTAATRGLVDAAAFAAMKPGAFLINTARGGVVDEAALLDALRTGRLAGAHVDVFATEPLPADSPLWDAPNLVITPHMADSVSDWAERFAAFFGDNLQRWLAGEPLMKVVDPVRGY